MTRPLTVLDAPSNLGLRPPEAGCVPGCYKLAGAVRDHGLLRRLEARDAGVVVPPRYVPDWEPSTGTVRNGEAIARYSRQLAERVGRLLEEDSPPSAGRHAQPPSAPELLVVLGGDCSILLGDMLALRRRGRYGLAFLDGHSDFRHPGNAESVGSVGGEDLALVTGRGTDDLADLDGLRPYVRDEDVAVVGIRDDDEALSELRDLPVHVEPAAHVRGDGAGQAGRRVLDVVARPELAGFWLHLDVDVLDAEVMPAVDSPSAGGLDFSDLVDLLAVLLASPRAVGLEITVFDPDLDLDGSLAGALTDCLVKGLHAALG